MDGRGSTLGAFRRADVEGEGLALVLTDQAERLGPNGRPALGELQAHGAGRGVARAVRQGDGEPMSSGSEQRPDVGVGIQSHAHPGHDDHRPADFALGLVVDPVADLAGGFPARSQPSEARHRNGAAERLAEIARGHAGPVVQRALPRMAEEVGCRGDGSGVRRQHRHRAVHLAWAERDLSVGIRLHVPLGGRHQATRHGHRVGAGVPHQHVDAVRLSADHPVVVGQRIGHEARRNREGPLRVSSLVRLFRRGEEDLGAAVVRLGRQVALAPIQQGHHAVERAGTQGRPRAVRARGEPPARGRAVGAGSVPPRHPGERGVDALEQPAIALGGPILQQGERYLRGADILEPSHVLRAVQAPARHRDLVVRLAHGAVEHPAVQGDGRRRAVEPGRAVELQRGPGPEPLLAT